MGRIRPESSRSATSRTISAGACASHGPKTAAQVAAQGSSRLVRATRLRDLYFRCKKIKAVTINAIAANLDTAMNRLMITVYIPSVCTIKPMMIADVKYQNM